MAKEQGFQVTLSQEEKELALRAVGDHIKSVAALASKVDTQGYKEAAREIIIKLEVLKNLETKLL